jgi:iron complex outermembrane receptor protein
MTFVSGQEHRVAGRVEPGTLAAGSVRAPRLALAYCVLGLFLNGWTDCARAGPALERDIPPQPVAEALAEFAHQTGLQLVYESTLARDRRSNGTRAAQSPAEALAQLLAGTGLTFEFLNARTVRIFAAPAASPTSPPTAAVRASSRPEHLAASPTGRTEEVIVIGSRGEEPLSRTPISMAIWTSEAMAESGATSLGAIAALTPGVEYDFDTAVGPGISTSLSIRGVNDAGGRSTTRLFIDGAPVHSLQSDFGELRPALFDLDRVEILRGPQGALLGEGTEGGAVRFIMRQPSLTSFTGLSRSEVGATEHGTLSYEEGLAAGGPIVRDAVGFRASAWFRRDGGYVDRVDPFTGATVGAKSNWAVSKSARLALTFAPADTLRITPSFSYQTANQNDSPIFYENLSDRSAGALRNGKLLRQPAKDTDGLATVTATATLPFGRIVSVGSYLHRAADALVDYTNSYPNYLLGQFGPLPVYPLSYANAAGFTHALTVDAWTEDLRLRSPEPDARVTWVVGLFYSNIHQQDLQTLVDSAVFFGQTDPTFGIGSTIKSRILETQLAGFAETDLKISPHLSANVALRLTRDESRQDKSYANLKAALPITGSPAQTDKPVSPRIALSYQPTSHGLYYASISEGYRSAGVDPPLPFPCTNDAVVPFDADSVWSYEAGAKNSVLGGRVQFDVSGYFMRWRNLHQLLFGRTSCGQVSTENSATSSGFDIGLQAVVTQSMRANVAVAYTSAHYTDTSYISGAGSNGRDYFTVSKGDWIGTLPQIPSPWTLTAALDYEFAVGERAMASIRLQDVFHSHNPGPFSTRPISQGCCLQGPPYPPLPWAWSVTDYPSADPATNVINFRARLSRSSVDLTFFVDNVLNTQPLLLGKTEGSYFGVVLGPPLVYGTTFRPRTTGLTVDLRF